MLLVSKIVNVSKNVAIEMKRDFEVAAGIQDKFWMDVVDFL